MYRLDVILRAALPLAAIQYLTYKLLLQSFDTETIPNLLLPIGLTVLAGSWAIRRLEATLHELLLALAASTLYYVVAGVQWLLWLGLYLGATALFLLPLRRVSGADRLPGTALGAIAALAGWWLALGYSLGGGSLSEALTYGLMFSSYGQLFALPIAAALTLADTSETGTARKVALWLGAVPSGAWVLLWALLTLVGFPQ